MRNSNEKYKNVQDNEQGWPLFWASLVMVSMTLFTEDLSLWNKLVLLF